MPRELARTVMNSIAATGADTFFGVPGGGPNLEKVGAGVAAGMRFVLAHGETAACIMAAAYGKLTGTAGVAIATRGPGAASAVNGAAQATLDRYPLVLLTDVVPAVDRDRVAHQRLDQTAIFTPVTKWSGTVGRAGAVELTEHSVLLASAAPQGAVHLDFDPTGTSSEAPRSPESAAFDLAALSTAQRLIGDARRPLFLIGAEAIPWADVINQTVQAIGAPAMVTYQAKGVVPSSSPNYAGLFTNGWAESRLLEAADLIVAVGLDPVEPIPGQWRSTAPVVSLNPWRIEDPYYPINAELTGPIDEALDILGKEFPSEWDEGAGQQYNSEFIASLREAGQGMGPFELVDAVIASVPERSIATVDAGAHFLSVMPLWPVERPLELLISNGLATMGFAVPAAIGAALANPDVPVVCMVGDGGLSMTLAELETIRRLNLNVTVVVFNDSTLSLIEVKQGDGHGGPNAVRYGDVNFAHLAAAIGIDAFAVEDANQVLAAMKSGTGPRLIDARIDPSPYRHAIGATRGV